MNERDSIVPFVFTRFPVSLSSIRRLQKLRTPFTLHARRFISPSSPSSKSSDSSPPWLFYIVSSLVSFQQRASPFLHVVLGSVYHILYPFLYAPRCPSPYNVSALFSAGTPLLEQCFHTTCLGDSSTLRRDSATTSSYNASLSGPLPRTY